MSKLNNCVFSIHSNFSLLIVYISTTFVVSRGPDLACVCTISWSSCLVRTNGSIVWCPFMFSLLSHKAQTLLVDDHSQLSLHQLADYATSFHTLQYLIALSFSHTASDQIRWAHPYPGISPTFRQCTLIRTKVFQALVPINPPANWDAMNCTRQQVCSRNQRARGHLKKLTLLAKLT